MRQSETASRRPPIGSGLAVWLQWLETLHPLGIDLGLERLRRVAERAGLARCPVPLLVVGGTNGKGSTVARLGRVYRAAGYRTGTYFSPHIMRFNERIRIDGHDVDDRAILEAFETLVPALGEDTLTYFEFTTLAAMHVFLEREVELIVLEVGLGGRLDATNLWQPDCAIVTSIALDHQDWLGHDRAHIGVEKAGIGRCGKPLIIGDPDPPVRMLRFARARGMQLIRPVPQADRRPAHEQRNIACVRAAVAVLADRLPVSAAALAAGTGTLTLAGRFERVRVDQQSVYLDVAHNPAAAAALLDTLDSQLAGCRLHLVLAMLADKDAYGVAQVLAPRVDAWYCASPACARAMPVKALCATVCSVPGVRAEAVRSFASVGAAWQAAHQTLFAIADTTSILLVTGSFHTIAAVRTFWQSGGFNVVPRPFDD